MKPLKRRIFSIVMAVSIVTSLFSIMPSIAAADTLNSASTWAREGIAEAVGKGFVPTNIQNNYANVITRQEFCRMAVKWVEYVTRKNIDAVLVENGVNRNPNAFTDTSDSDILAAFALGITSGTGNKQFSPNGQFSREQAATMIMNTCKAVGMDVSNIASADFADIEAASNWAVNSINFVRNAEIMQGTGNGNFSPKSTYTREQSIITFNNIEFLPNLDLSDWVDDSGVTDSNNYYEEDDFAEEGVS